MIIPQCVNADPNFGRQLGVVFAPYSLPAATVPSLARDPRCVECRLPIIPPRELIPAVPPVLIGADEISGRGLYVRPIWLIFRFVDAVRYILAGRPGGIFYVEQKEETYALRSLKSNNGVNQIGIWGYLSRVMVAAAVAG